jgi:hypothetical protein
MLRFARRLCFRELQSNTEDHAAMQIATTHMNGTPANDVDIRLDTHGRLWLDGQPVLATQVVGSRVQLIIPGAQHWIAATDYIRVRQAALDQRH